LSNPLERTTRASFAAEKAHQCPASMSRHKAEAIGTEVSASSLIRALIKREAKARGLDVKPGEAATSRARRNPARGRLRVSRRSRPSGSAARNACSSRAGRWDGDDLELG
jgi:hypothetical protein